MTQGIKVTNLQTTGSFANASSILLLTDNQNNTVNLLGKNAFIQSIVNSGTDNGIEVINNQLKVANIGNLADLDTSDKTSVVNAINEVKGNSGGLPSQSGHAGDLLTTDGTNPSWADTTEVYPVIETYMSGVSWYRIEAPDSTGYRWCRMGGLYYKDSTLAGTDNTIAFLKTFKDLSYTFTPTPLHSDANLNQYQIYEKYTLRTTSSTVLRTVSAIFGYEWIAEGYIENET